MLPFRWMHVFHIPIWGSLSIWMTACQRIRLLRWFFLWMWSDGSAFSCRYSALTWPEFLYGVWWGGGTLICICLIASIREGIYYLTCLGSGISEYPSRRAQIHPICWLLLSYGVVWIYLLWQTFSLYQCCEWWYQCRLSSVVEPEQDFFLMPACVRNVHHFYQFPEWLVSVALDIILVVL